MEQLLKLNSRDGLTFELTRQAAEAFLKDLREATVVAVDAGTLAVAVDVPGHGAKTYALWDALYLGMEISAFYAAQDRQDEEARRVKGASPRAEVSQFVMDEKDNPVGLRKTFRY